MSLRFAAHATLTLWSAACNTPEPGEVPECVPPLDAPISYLDATGNWPGGGGPANLTVVEATRSTLRVAVPDSGAPLDPFVELTLRDSLAATVTLPLEGEDVVVWTSVGCEQIAYVRITSLTGELLMEAGDPRCLSDADRARWDPPPWLDLREPAEALDCRTGDCTAEEREITLSVDGAIEVLPVGGTRELNIDGRRYLAGVLRARLEPLCGIIDGERVVGSAYLAPLGP